MEFILHVKIENQKQRISSNQRDQSKKFYSLSSRKILSKAFILRSVLLIISSDSILSSEELRLLTRRASSFLQIEVLNKKLIPYKLDKYNCPIVEYNDAKPFFLMQGSPLPRGLTTDKQ